MVNVFSVSVLQIAHVITLWGSVFLGVGTVNLEVIAGLIIQHRSPEIIGADCNDQANIEKYEQMPTFIQNGIQEVGGKYELRSTNPKLTISLFLAAFANGILWRATDYEWNALCEALMICLAVTGLFTSHMKYTSFLNGIASCP